MWKLHIRGNGEHGQALVPTKAWFPIRSPPGDAAEAEMLRDEVTDGPAEGLGKAREQWAKRTCSLNDNSMIFHFGKKLQRHCTPTPEEKQPELFKGSEIQGSAE